MKSRLSPEKILADGVEKGKNRAVTWAIRFVSRIFHQEKHLDKQEKQEKSTGIGLPHQQEKQHPQRAQGQGNRAFPGMLPASQGQNRASQARRQDDGTQKQPAQPGTGWEEGEEIDRADLIPCLLAEDREKQQQSRAAVQKPEDLIPQTRAAALLVLLGQAQHLLAGEQAVDGHPEKTGDGLQRVDAGIAPAGLPFGNGGPGDEKLHRQLLLGQAPLPAQSL